MSCCVLVVRKRCSGNGWEGRLASARGESEGKLNRSNQQIKSKKVLLIHMQFIFKNAQLERIEFVTWLEQQMVSPSSVFRVSGGVSAVYVYVALCSR